MATRKGLRLAVQGILIEGPAYAWRVAELLPDEDKRGVHGAIRRLLRDGTIAREPDGRLGLRVSVADMSDLERRLQVVEDQRWRRAQRSLPLTATIQEISR
mgnify:FL=1